MKMWCTFLLLLCLVVQISAVTRPPGIFIQADYNIYYKAGETVEMPCVANGDPRPIYTWKRNLIEFNPSGNDDRVVQLANVGTIVITKPEDKDEGIFQCFAKNSFGTSLSININLREAKLKDFEVGSDTYLSPTPGQPLTLNCVPPESIPPPQVFWVLKKPNGGFDPINYDDRVTMDHEYRLRITNVKRSDYQDGRAYACMALNNIMRKSTQGPQYFIMPQGGAEDFSPVSYLWASPDDHFGLRGTTFRVKCIFSGNPTPDVHWERTDGGDLPKTVKITSFGQEMQIENLQFEDAGTYECWATNTNTQTRVQRTVNVRVESSPYWLLEPQDVEIGVNGTAEYNCLANAEPPPEYYWFINGVRLEDVKDPRITPDRFKRPRPDRVVFIGVVKDDPMVIQCNATNKHGYIWGDAYLNVLSEAPTIIESPEPQKVVAEGTSVNLTCRVTGKPDPIITWYKNEQQITGGRYKIMINGDLYIKQVVLSDAGAYKCEARNVFNTTSANGILLVRRKTRIELAPQDLEVFAGTDAKFTCSGTTDPEEVDKLQIIWLKDNKEISTVVQRMTKNRQDNSLTISGTIVRDSGTYTCIATNNLDNATASAMLTVKDRPDVPTKAAVERCKDRNATIVWTPGSYNNAPVQYFIIQYNTSFTPDTWTFAKQVDSIYNSANVSLSPWVNYTFRVIAYNKIGESDPSFPTPQVCMTSVERPSSHPQNLRTIGDLPNFLHIEWTPMPAIMQNGPGFQYILQLRREGQADSTVQQIPIDSWSTFSYKYPTPNQIYEPYQISIRARNSAGDANQDAPTIRGFTAESVPSVMPTNLRADQIMDTVANISWDFNYAEINKTPSNIHGEFRGFKIQFWQLNYKADTFREKDVSPEEALKSRRNVNTFSTVVEDLLPFTNMELQVAVMNNYYVSRPTDIIRFKTDAGFPGPVELFRPINVGDNHVNLEWKAPEENRGDILGYDIGYQLVTGLDLGEMQEREPQINDPYTTTAILSGLLSSTRYRIHIWARTTKGRGEGFFIELNTTQAGDPQAPRFTITDVGSTYINVSWWINPYAKSGTVVYVEYRKQDAAEWLRSTDEVISNWKNISGLEPGSLYELRIVATTGNVLNPSHIEEVRTKGIAVAWALVGNYGWFVGMIISLLLLIALIIVFVILFRKGKRFKPRSSPSNSYYGGDSAAYSGRYDDKTSHIPKRSSDFGPEPRGYSNDYYDDKDRDDAYHDPDGYDDRDYYPRDTKEKAAYYDHSEDYDDRDDHAYDDYHRKNDRDDHDDYRDEEYDEDPPRYSPKNRGRDRDQYGDPNYEDYNRKPSDNLDPDFDYREPHRFDRNGAPVDNRKRSGSQGAASAASAAASTFV